MLLGKYLRAQHGNVGTMFAIAILPIMLASGAAIDMVRINNTRTTLQGAADAAAVAGAVEGDNTPANLDKLVQDYLFANNSAEVLTSITEMKQWTDAGGSTFNVKIGGKLQTSLMSLAGIAAIDIGVHSQVNLGAQAIEIALVLDNTGSMAGSKIANLKTSAKELVDIIERTKSAYSIAKIGVVPFAEYVNVGTYNASASWMDPMLFPVGWAGCVGSRNSPDDEFSGYTNTSKYAPAIHSNCGKEVLPLTTSLAAVRSKIDSMTASGSTYVPGGLLWGWNLLDSAAPFSEGMTKAQTVAKQGRKAIVLMTDGENTVSPTYPEHNGSDPALSNQKLSDICAHAKGDDIEIFTVSFMVPTVTIKDILSNCASAPDKYFDADNGTELFDAFQKIGESLSTVRLTQ